MKAFFKLCIHFALAVLTSFILASLLHTQFVLHELVRLGIQIDLATRLSSSLDDMQGLLPGYGSVIGISLLLGFAVMAWLQKRRPQTGPWVYPLGGFLAILVALFAMQPIFGVTLIAGARSTAGMLCQCLAGLCGGWVFMYARQHY